jgi:hypothetical protein
LGHGSLPCLTERKGMGKEGWDHSPLEGEWTHLVKVKSPMPRILVPKS